jgi:hypothetical protein
VRSRELQGGLSLFPGSPGFPNNLYQRIGSLEGTLRSRQDHQRRTPRNALQSITEHLARRCLGLGEGLEVLDECSQRGQRQDRPLLAAYRLQESGRLVNRIKAEFARQLDQLRGAGLCALLVVIAGGARPELGRT